MKTPLASMKLAKHQKILAGATSKYVIARWGRRTGKEVLVISELTEEDVLVYPSSMSHFYRREYGCLENVVPEHSLWYVLSRSPRKRVFVMEAAFMDRLYKVLDVIEDFDVDQVYILSTPNLQSRITSSGFLFDAICARLKVSLVKDYTYSQVGYSDTPFADEHVMDNMKSCMPDRFHEEIEADYKGREDKKVEIKIEVSCETNND